MKKMGFRMKLTIYFILFMVIVSSLSIYLVYKIALSAQKEELRRKLVSVATTTTLLIDGDKHQQIEPRPESKNTPIFQELEAQLTRAIEANPAIDSIYTLVKTDKKYIWKFVLDESIPNEAKKEEAEAYCGEEYDVSHLPEMRQAFDGPIADRELNRDKWGIWLSGYAPIYNRKGQAVAVLGVDMEAKTIANLQKGVKQRTLIVFGLGTLLSILIGSIAAAKVTRCLRQLVAGTRRVASGDLSQKVNIKAKDEIGELALSFNYMIEQLDKSYQRVKYHFLETIHSLATALEAKDVYTRGHSERVTRYAVQIAQKLNLPKEKIDLIQQIGILHDIGKIGVREEILNKPDKLTDKEWKFIQMHPIIGESILKFVEMLQPGLPLVRHHHERMDGRGYPDGLTKDKIIDIVRIITVADAYDAMTSQRPYREALTTDEAINELMKNKGTQFDPEVVEAFIQILKSSSSY